MADIITTLHPENDENTNLYPNIKKDNIPNVSIDRSKLDSAINSLLDSINSLHPAGVDTSTNILAFTEDKGVWVGSDTGYWYYWNGIQYAAGGNYMASTDRNHYVFNVIGNYVNIDSANNTIGFVNTGGNICVVKPNSSPTYLTIASSAAAISIPSTKLSVFGYDWSDNTWKCLSFGDNIGSLYILCTIGKINGVYGYYHSKINDILVDGKATKCFNTLRIENSDLNRNILGIYTAYNMGINIDSTNNTIAFKDSNNVVVLGSGNTTYISKNTTPYTIPVPTLSTFGINTSNNTFSCIGFNSAIPCDFIPLIVMGKVGTKYTIYYTKMFNLYIDDLPFTYYENPKNYKIIILGDSITADTSNQGWVYHFKNIINCTVTNVAVGGAQLQDNVGTTYDGNPQYENPTNNVLGNQVQKIINNNYAAPDIIIIAIGTNNGLDNVTLDNTSESYFSNGSKVALTDLDRKTTIGAFRYCNEKLQLLYPNAKIFWSSPIARATRTPKVSSEYSDNLSILTRCGNVNMIDSLRCGINLANETAGSNGTYLRDGLHPNSNGALVLGTYIADNLKKYLD